MIKNNFKLALRNLLRNKAQSAILVGGLAAGMASCILLLQYVSFELSFDNFHTKKNDIYRVVNERIQNGASIQKGTITYPTVGPAMLEEFPEVVNATRIAYSFDFMITHKQGVKPIEPGLWVDEHFFEIFDYEILAGDGLSLLDEPNEMVLTRSIANQYFPAAKGNYEAVIGEELKIDRYVDPFKVVGVCEDAPTNGLLDFEVLLSYASSVRYWGEGADNSWTWSDFYHFLELQPGTDIAALESKFTDFSERHFRGTEVSGSKEIFSLQSLADAHLYSGNLEYEIGRTANGKAVWSLLIIAFFILLIAWINYVNLSSVKAIERSKEVGVRKVVGATRGQLIRQFFTEALVVNLLSLFIALGLVQIANPWFASNFGLDASALSFFTGNTLNVYLLGTLIALLTLGVFASGIYPALLLSSGQISNVLKGVFSKKREGAWMRKGLVVFQFTMSIALITAAWMVSRQIDYMSKQDLGINIDQVITVNSPERTEWDSTFIDKMNTFKSELTNYSTIHSAATSSRSPGEGMGRIFQIQKLGEDKSDQVFSSNFINADFEYAKTYGIEPLAGRFFRQTDHSIDWTAVDKIIVNEAFIKKLGYSTNESALNQRVRFWDKDWNIVGVVPNFHQRSLHYGIKPILLIPGYGNGHLLSLKISGENMEETITYVKSTYDEFFPGNTFEYAFVDENFQRLYEADTRFGNILSFFTLLAIFIACLGLFGLASYMTFLRTKEIGIRKVLGASIAGIVVLLSKDFLKLVLIALVIACPIAYYLMGQWLDGFAYRIDIQWWIFALAGIAALAVAFITVSFQSIKAAITNPIDSLRNE